MKIEREGVNGVVDPELTKKIVSLVDADIEWNMQNTSEDLTKPLEIFIVNEPPFVYKRFYVKSKINSVILSTFGHYSLNTASGQITNVGINFATQNETIWKMNSYFWTINGNTQNEAALEDAKKLLIFSGINLTE